MYYTFTTWDKKKCLTNGFSWIPYDESNADYRQYLAWVAEGNTPEQWNPENEAQ